MDPKAPLTWAEALDQGHFDNSHRPDVSDRYFLAASTHEFLTRARSVVVKDPNLYLRFAIAEPDAATFFEYANTLGLLGSPSSTRMHYHLQPSDSEQIIDLFDWGPDPESGILRIQMEPASKWLRTFATMRTLVEMSTSPQGLAQLDSKLKIASDANLIFSLNVSQSLGRLQSELHAATLDDLIKVQWGMSATGGVVHRQCLICSAWFGVHPSINRRDKLFCSDACRMRAYRKRKSGKVAVM